MKVRFTARARLRAERVAAWWRENRPDAADLFELELSAAVTALEVGPPVPGVPYATVRGVAIRRLLLPKSEQHVYFSSDPNTGLVLVHTVWGARRRRGPSL